jgi:hypothetical protein
VASLRLGGLRGKQSTPSDWLGGTGEISTVGKQKRHRAREAARSAGHRPRQVKGNGTIFTSGRVECFWMYVQIYM